MQRHILHWRWGAWLQTLSYWVNLPNWQSLPKVAIILQIITGIAFSLNLQEYIQTPKKKSPGQGWPFVLLQINIPAASYSPMQWHLLHWRCGSLTAVWRTGTGIHSSLNQWESLKTQTPKKKPPGQGGLLYVLQIISRQRPTLPYSEPYSTIGDEALDFRVRDGNGYFHLSITTGNCGVVSGFLRLIVSYQIWISDLRKVFL